MSSLAIHRESSAIALPAPRGGAMNIRLAVPGAGAVHDLKFIDDLQRKHSKMVGWMPTKQLEANIAKGKVLIAEENNSPSLSGRGSGGGSSDGIATNDNVFTHPPAPSLKGGGVPPLRVGYCISSDRYFKRDDCGIVYQLNVVPHKQRGLIGASLVKAVFERAAYGCKLFCCWCAQDLQANYFWESLGFVPLAFRTGARPRLKKDGTLSKPERIHIFWQRRINQEEGRRSTGGTPGVGGTGVGGTPYWFPAETTGGALKENRLVLPIPPGTHWSDAKPAVLPGAVLPGMEGMHSSQANALPSSEGVAAKRSRTKAAKKAVLPHTAIVSGGLRFRGPEEAKVEKPKREKAVRHKHKNDPKFVEAARELRDRYIEQINAAADALLPSANGKYDVSRQLSASVARSEVEQLPRGRLLKAA